MRTPMLKLAAGLVVALLADVANADPLTFSFSGQVSTILSDDSSNTFSANFALGDAVTGIWVIDTSAVGTVLIPGQVHYYDATFSVTISGKTFSGPAQYRIFNNAPVAGDGFSIVNESGTYSGPSLGPLMPSTFFVQYLGMPTTTLSDFSLITDPVSLIPLADLSFVPHGFRLDNPDGTFGGLYFTVDHVSAVPEPGTLALLGIALIGLIGAGRKFRVPSHR